MELEKDRHTCPRCGKCFAKHSALYGHLRQVIPCPDLVRIRKRLAKRRKVDASVNDASSEVRDSTSTHHLPSPAATHTEETVVPDPKDSNHLENEAPPDFLDESASPVDHPAVPTSDEPAPAPFRSKEVMMSEYQRFQIDLLNTLSKYRVPLGLHDEVIDVVKRHIILPRD